MSEAVLVNGFENGGGDHQISLSVNGKLGFLLSVMHTAQMMIAVLFLL